MRAPYRNDQDALMARLVALLDELEQLRGRAHDLDGVARDTTRVEREIAGLRREIERVAPARLPLLDRVAIASPCSADWEAMTGDERSRHCAQCDKQVYNLAAMGAEEAEDFLRARAGNACLRIYRRADGTVLTSDCPVGVRRRRRRRAVVSLVGGGLVAAGALVAGAMARGAMATGVAVRPVTGAVVWAVPSVEATATREIRMPMGLPPPVHEETQVEAEMARVRRLLEQHAKMTSPDELRAVENEIRASRERIGALSKKPARSAQPAR